MRFVAPLWAKTHHGRVTIGSHRRQRSLCFAAFQPPNAELLHANAISGQTRPLELARDSVLWSAPRLEHIPEVDATKCEQPDRFRRLRRISAMPAHIGAPEIPRYVQMIQARYASHPAQPLTTQDKAFNHPRFPSVDPHWQHARSSLSFTTFGLWPTAASMRSTASSLTCHQ